MAQHKLQCPLQIKDVSEEGVVSGYASVFGEVDSYRDVVAPGAFARSLKQWQNRKQNPPMLWQHDARFPRGVWDSVKEDDSGLYVSGKLALKTSAGAEAFELLKMGAVTGLSIGYRTVKSTTDSKKNIRILTDLDLFEVSLVTFPANDSARIRVVKAADEVQTERDFEKFLREEGFSRDEAETICRRGFKALSNGREDRAEVDDCLAAIRRVQALVQPAT
ncbi:MAG TPA: HK97 family phage prohead protease [Alphaproteobacteria bacterium]|nr:HK97 family phage prohead protease [Alphaproteobacteria bacterium]